MYKNVHIGYYTTEVMDILFARVVFCKLIRTFLEDS